MLIDRHTSDHQVGQVLKGEACIIHMASRAQRWGTWSVRAGGGPLPPKDGRGQPGTRGITPGGSQLGRSGMRGETRGSPGRWRLGWTTLPVATC